MKKNPYLVVIIVIVAVVAVASLRIYYGSGVKFRIVFKNGPADDAGLMAGDIITSIDQTNIRDTRDVLDMVAKGQPGDIIEISGIRQRQSFMTSATLGQRPQESR